MSLSYKWVPIKHGQPLPLGSVYAGTNGEDGDCYVARDDKGMCGKLNVENGKMHNIWVQGNGKSSSGDILVTMPGVNPVWVRAKRGDPIPEGRVYSGKSKDDGEVFVARNLEGTPGKLNTSNGSSTGTFHNLWVHDKSAVTEGDILTIKLSRWVRIKRGDDLPEGVVQAGETKGDGPIYVARNLHGICGKLNVDKGKMWNLWVHDESAAQDGEVLCVPPYKWVSVSRGDELPPGSVFAGKIDKDGEVYVARHSGACGKLNLDDGKVHNIWVHGPNDSQKGEVLVVTGSFEWRAIKRGETIPEGAVHAGHTSNDGDVFVARNSRGEPGKLNIDKGCAWNLWCHGGGSSQDGEILVVQPYKWVPIKRGEELPRGAVYSGTNSKDGDVYVARMFTTGYGGGGCGKLNLDNGKMWNIWVQGERSAAQEGEVLVIPEE